MTRINIDFLVTKQFLSLVTKEPLRATDRNYFYAVFDLCDTWSNVSGIKASFVRDDLSFVIPLEAGADGCLECLIPWEVMQDKGEFYVGVFGGDRILTNRVRVDVAEGCLCDGGLPQAPTEDWFFKMEQNIEDLNDDMAGGKAGQVLSKASNDDNDFEWVDITVDLGNYYTKDETDEALKNVSVDLTDYYTKTQTDKAIEAAVSAIPGTDLSNYYTKTEIDSIVGDVASALDAINGEVI